MDKYTFREYNPIFPELFNKEKQRLGQFLAGEFRIEHVGSTAVPGLGGKGTIDIHIVVPAEKLYAAFGAILKAGYIYDAEAFADWAFFFNIALPDSLEGTRNYHIHLAHTESKNFVKMVKFRDHLRTHPEDLKKYADAKRAAGAKAGNERRVYVNMKEPVIVEILAEL